MPDSNAIETRVSWAEGKLSSSRPHQTFDAAMHSETDDCIVWPHKKSRQGYGQIRIGGRVRYAHRLICEEVHGLPPTDKHYACHAPVICHNRLCINPRHLRWATPSENTYDKRLDGTDNRGEANPQAKLTAKDVIKIRASDKTTVNLASEYGVSQSYISTIKTRKKWRHI